MDRQGSRTDPGRTIDLTRAGSAPVLQVLDSRDATPPFLPSVAYSVGWHHGRFQLTLSVTPDGFPEYAQWVDFDASIHDGDRSRSIRFEPRYRLIAGPRVNVVREVTQPGWWDPVEVGSISVPPEAVPTLQIDGAGLPRVVSYVQDLFDRYSEGWSFSVPIDG